MPFFISYHPIINRLINILKKDFLYLQGDNSLLTTVNQPPLLAFRKPPVSKRCLLQDSLPIKVQEGTTQAVKPLDVRAASTSFVGTKVFIDNVM